MNDFPPRHLQLFECSLAAYAEVTVRMFVSCLSDFFNSRRSALLQRPNWHTAHVPISVYNWRAGASQPSGANGAIFPLYLYIYIFIYLYITGAAYVVSNSTLHAHAHAHVKLQSAVYA